MKSSTFSFCVAVWCAGVAAFVSQDLTFVVLNASLALLNLGIGLLMHKKGL